MWEIGGQKLWEVGDWGKKLWEVGDWGSKIVGGGRWAPLCHPPHLSRVCMGLAWGHCLSDVDTYMHALETNHT